MADVTLPANPEADLIEAKLWMLDDIADRDAQTRPITKPEDLPLGRDGTKYDHARWQASEYHLDTLSLALGDRHLLLREVRRLQRALARERQIGREEAVREVRDETGLDEGWQSRDPGVEQVNPFDLNAILDRVAGLNVSEPPPLHTDRCGKVAQQASHELIWKCDPSCVVGDASESGQPPEAHGDE